jgi:hypothetical protein
MHAHVDKIHRKMMLVYSNNLINPDKQKKLGARCIVLMIKISKIVSLSVKPVSQTGQTGPLY